MSNLRKALIKLAHENEGEVRDALLPLLKQASSDWIAIFDSLRPRQSVYVAMTSVMGMNPKLDGEFHEWTVGRKATSKKYGYETITLLSSDGSKIGKGATFKLWKKPGRSTISASSGNMALMLKGLKK